MLDQNPDASPSSSGPRSSGPRFVAGVLAVVSGGYSLVGATGEMAVVLSEWFMLLLGVVAVSHGLALLVTGAERFGRANGPVICLWATAMALVQFRVRSSPRFADGGVWTSNPGDPTWMLGLAALAFGSGLVLAWLDLRTAE